MRRARTQVGILTSGNFSPMRERGIGLGFVDADARLLDGDAVTIVQRGRELAAHASCGHRCGRSAKRASEHESPAQPVGACRCRIVGGTTEYAD